MINLFFTTLTVEVEGLDVSIVSLTKDCSLGTPFSVINLEIDGDKAESVPRKTRLSSVDFPENALSPIEAITSFL